MHFHHATIFTNGHESMIFMMMKNLSPFSTASFSVVDVCMNLKSDWLFIILKVWILNGFFGLDLKWLLWTWHPIGCYQALPLGFGE